MLRRAVVVLLLALPVPALAQTPLERGRTLVEGIAACGNCHTPKGPQGDLPGMAFAGGLVIDEPNAFRAVTSNITPDPETGIGRWTDAQIIRAIREGVRPDGRVLGPPMPFALYRDISDRDATAIVAYLRSLRPVRNVVEASRYPMPLPPAYGPPLGTVAGPADTPIARGAYLGGPLGHCIECHSPMGTGGQRDFTRAGTGGPPLNGPMGAIVPPAINGPALRGWTDAQIERAIRQGVSSDGRRLAPPMAFPHYARIGGTEMRDLIAYLRSLP
ncbi:c-type cytochrome [Rhodovarius crocodyli]|nr:cytochrome c [Rhodovarius crocodyli]